MALQVSVGGRLTGVPGVYQDGIELAGVSSGAVLESGVVAIVGECAGTIQPKTPVNFRTSARLKEQLGSGALYDAARLAFQPSNEAGRRGASRVVAVRVNPATQGNLTLESAAPADLIALVSRAWGAKAAGLAVTVEAGTQGATGRKVAIAKPQAFDEIGDDLGYLPALLVRYTGDAATATITISATQITTALAGQSDGSVALTIPFATYPTIQEITNFINAQDGYEAVAITPQAATFLGASLDYVTGANIKTKTGTITLASSTATTFSGTISSLATGDVIGVGGEYLYTSNHTTPTVIRGYGNSTPNAHTSAAGATWHAATKVVQDMIDFCNLRSANVTASRSAGAAVGIPALLAKTYLTGAGEGSTANSDWLAALDALKPYKVNFIVLMSEANVVRGYLKDHMKFRWGVGSSEAQGFCGFPADQPLSVLRPLYASTNDENITACFQEILRPNDAGVPTRYAPMYQGALLAGLQAGGGIGEPLTYKALDVLGVYQHSTIDLVEDAEDLILMRATFARTTGEGTRIVRALTTYQGSEDFYLISPNVRNAIAWTVYKVRRRVKERALGVKGVSNYANTIKSIAVETLDECRDQDEAIVIGSREVNGQVVTIPAYRNVTVSATGNVYFLDYEITPVDGVDFVIVRTRVGEFQSVA